MLKHKIFAFFTSCLSGILILFIIISNTFYTPLFFQGKSPLDKMLVQGWGFFTKSPRDVVVQAYDYSTGESIMLPRSSPKYLFGLSRVPSRITMEIGSSINNVEDSLWVKDYKNTTKYEKGSFVRKKSPFKHRILCDSLVVVNQERLAWAWHKYKDELSYPRNYAKVITYD